MRRFLFLVLIIVVFLGTALFALPFIVSNESIKNTITSTIQEKTGRTLTINGKTSLSAFPSLAIELGDVQLSNPDTMTKGTTISAEKMQVKLPLLPLLTGELQLDQFVLNKPVISLLKDKKGTMNWVMADTPKNQPTSPQNNTDNLGALKEIKLGRVKIINGLLSYQDQTTSAAYKISDINVDVTMASLTSPLAVKGDLTYRGEKVSLSLDLENPQKFLSGAQTPLKLEASSKLFKTQFGGVSTMKAGPQFSGNLTASSPSTKSLIVWTGSPPPAIGGLGPFNLSSKVSFANQQVALNGLSFGIDKMTAKGTAKIALGGARPKISGNLAFDVIDLNPYMSGSGGKSGKSAKRSAGGWSRDRIDLSALRSIDAALSLKANKLIARDIKVENGNLSLDLANGVLRTKLNQFTLYGGKGSGAITLNGRSSTPALASSMKLSGMNARNFLKDATGFAKIEGAAAFTYSISSLGASQHDLMKNMQGRGNFNFNNGAIRGINIAQMMRSLSSNIMNGWSASEAQKTDFSTFSGSYTIKNGLLQNSDLKLLGPLVRLTGAGTVSLPGRSLNYKVNPRLVASLKGQGGASNLAGLDVPIIIKGPWAKPQIYPDIAGILQNPDAAYRNLKNIGKAIDPKNGAKALDNLLKGNNQNGEQKDPIKALGKELKGLF